MATTAAASYDPIPALSKELQLPPIGVKAVVTLLNEGNTVPFIARYRKEATGGLDEVQIRDIQQRHAYLTELENRRETILTSIEDQGKLTEELKNKITACTTKTGLEDLYLPYRPKRRTRATIAREKGLEPLAEMIWEQPSTGSPQIEAASYLNEELGVTDEDIALSGARDILAERIAENADVRKMVREGLFKSGILHSEALPEFKDKPTKYQQYHDYHEEIANIPSHRFLAIRRGEREGVLKTRIEGDTERIHGQIHSLLPIDNRSPFADQLHLTVEDSYKRLLHPSIETDLRVELKLRSDDGAISVFASNVRDLLLASPLGEKSVVGIDPGIRTGCKCVAVDQTGKFLGHLTIYPQHGGSGSERAAHDLATFLQKFNPAIVAVGNGTAGRETESFAREVIKSHSLPSIPVLAVSESGASVYSASDIAREEFPDLDVSIRGAISIARRLQDPLAELVKIDPKAIGVGQYQHDVHQPMLQQKLDEVVESCVNHVGVELNTASAPLLARVAGIGPSIASRVVSYREENGPFPGRKKLLKVAGLGPKTFEQAAGFIRVRGGEHPLDASAVHPERYALVEQMAKDLNVSLKDLVGHPELADKIDIRNYVTSDVGEPTLRDIITELKKPGRDPRESFEMPAFREDVHTLEDLQIGMELEGVVTNVTNFGAFVDIGVHQDGLVHISQLADHFVKDAHDVVSAGSRLTVRVLDVDLVLRRISLTARKQDAETPTRRAPSSDSSPKRSGNKSSRQVKQKAKQEGFSNNPFAKLKR